LPFIGAWSLDGDKTLLAEKWKILVVAALATVLRGVMWRNPGDNAATTRQILGVAFA